MQVTGTALVLLELIHLHQPISRKELAQRSGLTQPTVTNITRELISHEYIIEGERISRGAGRKEVLLLSNPNKFHYLGIDIGGHKIRFALSNNNLEILHQMEVPMFTLHNPEETINALASQISQFLSDSQFSANKLDAIGIGVTGIVNAEQDRILNIPNACNWEEVEISTIGWDNVPIVSALQNLFHCPVFLDEGGRTMALAEKLFGKAKEVDNFIVVHVGLGIVAGLMSAGNLLRGESNSGGLLGHITVDENGKRCKCGNFGCLELYGTYPMMEERYRTLGGTFDSLAEGYRNNDKTALDVCIDAGNAIGTALSNVINLFNPKRIYLGGRPFHDLPIILDELKRTIRLRANRFATLVLEIEKTSFGEMEGIYGALTMAKSNLISVGLTSLQEQGEHM